MTTQASPLRPSRDNSAEDAEQRHANVEQWHGNVEQRHANVEQRHANIEQQHANVEQRRANVEQRQANVEQRQANVEQRHVNVEQQHANIFINVPFKVTKSPKSLRFKSPHRSSNFNNSIILNATCYHILKCFCSKHTFSKYKFWLMYFL